MYREYIINILNDKIKHLNNEIKYSKSTIDTYLEDDNEDWSEEIKDHEAYIKSLQKEKAIVLEGIECLNKECFNTHHKYIEEFMDIEDTPYGWSKNTGRDEMWAEQRKEYGFDERETWSLDAMFIYWLYERLRMYDEMNCVNTDFYKFNVNGVEITQQECIDAMIEKCKKYITYQGVDDDYTYNLKNEILDIWKVCIHSMWW